MHGWEWFVQQMGREKALIDFSEEAMQEDYVPYGAYNPFNDYRPADEPPIYINYNFSQASWQSSYSFKHWLIYQPPDFDLSEIMNIEVIV